MGFVHERSKEAEGSRAHERPRSQQAIRAEPFRHPLLLPHTEACGKQRRIDDGKASANNEVTQYTEKFTLTHAFNPATVAQALQRAVVRLQASEEHKRTVTDLRSGTEDMPDAFRTIPIIPDQFQHNFVMTKHCQTRDVYLFPMLAALFGNGSSVYAYVRLIVSSKTRPGD